MGNAETGNPGGSADPDAVAMDLEKLIDPDMVILRAIRRYQRFAKIEPPGEARDFAAHCNACKAAIAHLEQLIRFSRTLASDGPGTPPGQPDDDIERLIAEAEASLSET